MAISFSPEEFVLSNGIPVILQHYDGPAAASYWWVKTGSADERPSEAGFAHFLEHMLFKDAAAKETGQASQGQLAMAIESLGGDINAYTSFDQTVYHVTCAEKHWEKIFGHFGAMAKPQRFLKQDFEREREVILEELRKGEDSPDRMHFEQLFKNTFSKHPYGRPVIGFTRTLKAATVNTLEAYYRRRYISSNMGLILVGPLTEARKKELLKLAEKRFGSAVIKKTPLKEEPRPQENPLRPGALWTLQPFDVKQPSLAMTFRVPALKHAHLPALDLLSGILGMGEMSRFYQSLFYGKSLVTDVNAGMYVPSDPGMFYIEAEFSELNKTVEVVDGIFSEIKRFVENGPTEAELQRVMVNAESERLYATQTADGIASRIGFLKFVMGDLGFDSRYLEALREVDAAKLQQVAREYFDSRRMAAVLQLPKADKNFNLEPAKSAAMKALQELRPTATAAVKPPKKSRSGKYELPVERMVRPSGIQVLRVDRPASPVFSVYAVALGGLRLECGAPVESADKDWGASHLLSLTWTKGTSQKSSKDIATLVEGRAAGMDAFSGRNTVGLSMTGLSRDWDRLSDLFGEVLADPTLPESELEHSKRVAQDSIKSIEDRSSQLCTQLFLKTLYRDHPYSRLTYGSLESVAGMQREKLKKIHQQWVRPERLTLAVSGHVSESKLNTFLTNIERELSAHLSPGSARKFPEQLSVRDRIEKPELVEKSLGREQVHILVGGLGLVLNSEERFAVALMNTILGGQSGRLFIELREKKSLAYTVAPMSFEGMEKGYIGTYIGCSPNKREAALQGIQEVLEKLAQKGPSPKELARAKEYFLGHRAMELQSDGALASHFGLQGVYGITPETDRQFPDRVQSVTAKQIQEVCLKYLVKPNKITAIVG